MIPLSTTTISVWRLDPGREYDEPYGGPEPLNRTVVHAGIPAVIDSPAGALQLEGGQQNVGRYRLICDPIDLQYTDLIQDDQTGRYLRISTLHAYVGDHCEVDLYDTEGEV